MFFEDTKTFKALDQELANQVSKIDPHIFLYLVYLIIIFIIIFGVIKLWKLYKAPGSELIKQYKENFRKANEDSQQKSLILTLADQVNKELPSLIQMKYNHNPNLVERGRKILDMLVEQIPLCLKSTKNMNHRCAIFTVDPEDTSNLKIYEGCGYSIGGKENLRLKISASIAGKVYSKGEYIYCKDVTKEKGFVPNPKATKKYYSLLCVPVVFEGKTLAVLSIDGSEKDCFSEDDIQYLKLFSNQIAVIFGILGIDKVQGGIKNGEENKNIG